MLDATAKARKTATDAASDPETFLRQCETRLTVAFQPIFATGDGALFALEALCRGSESFGLSDPHALFEHAFAIGALPELELAQIRRAIEALTLHRQTPRPQLFVNLDTRIILAPGPFFDVVSAFLDAAGLTRDAICFELSERHDKLGSGALRDRIAPLRAAGFRFALDDFGAGVSDLCALTHFEIDALKIDRFLIDGIARDRRKRTVVSRLVDLAHLMGVSVVAEGVERQEDFDICRALRCDLAQGYLLGRPQVGRLRPPPVASAAHPARAARTDAEPAASSATLAAAIEPTPAFHRDMPAYQMIDVFRDPASSAFFPVVGDRGEPVGIVRESAFRAFIYTPYGIDLLHNRAAPIRVGAFVAPCPTADISVDPDHLVDLLGGDLAEGVIAVSNMAYAGFAPSARLLRLHSDRRLARAQDENPLTGLPGNRAIARFIGAVARASDAPRYLAYFDFDNFKPFNDRYGFQRGDEAIRLFASLLRKHFDPDRVQLGHIGGDDFFVGSIGVEIAEMERRAARLLDGFANAAAAFYDPIDRARGAFLAPDRAGAEQRYPLLRCSAGVLRIPAGSAAGDASALGAQIGAVKRSAKTCEHGLAVITFAA